MFELIKGEDKGLLSMDAGARREERGEREEVRFVLAVRKYKAFSGRSGDSDIT